MLVNDLSWFDLHKLDGFVEELKDILSKNPLLSNERIERIGQTVEKNISRVYELQYQIEQSLEEIEEEEELEI